MRQAKAKESVTGERIFAENCNSCHGQFGQGGPNPTRSGDIIAPISSSEFLKTRDDYTIRNIISQGQPNSGMSPFEDTNGGQLSADQVDAVVAFIRSWEANPPADLLPESPPAITPTPGESAQPTSGGTLGSFSEQVLPIFKAKCMMCHNSETALGGWDSTSYQSVMTSGESGSVVIAGDAVNSILAQRILGKQLGIMPMSGQLPENELQIILDWITAGALDN